MEGIDNRTAIRGDVCGQTRHLPKWRGDVLSILRKSLGSPSRGHRLVALWGPPPASTISAIGMPLCRPLSGGLWEVHSSLPSKRAARVLFGFHQRTLIALRGLTEKTQADAVR